MANPLDPPPLGGAGPPKIFGQVVQEPQSAFGRTGEENVSVIVSRSPPGWGFARLWFVSSPFLETLYKWDVSVNCYPLLPNPLLFQTTKRVVLPIARASLLAGGSGWTASETRRARRSGCWPTC
jgi:hypothetical protein